MSRMSLAEKVEQIRNTTPGIPRLGVPAYDYWSEALHGVGFAGTATVFPTGHWRGRHVGHAVDAQRGDVISTEARAKFNDYANQHNGDSKRFYCLTFWSPNVNIFRDPRWGRGQETYGEDPFLTGSFAVAFIQGLQGDDPKYIKAMGCAKHYAVHSGPEPVRHEFNAAPPERDLYETYLPQFEMAVREGHVGGVMGAYSALDGVPCCANRFLLTDILRNQWGFDGYIVSDCDAVHDIYSGHHYRGFVARGGGGRCERGVRYLLRRFLQCIAQGGRTTSDNRTRNRQRPLLRPENPFPSGPFRSARGCSLVKCGH